ncbi:MAG: TraB/GumN family protein [Dokdonella sp.]
MISSTFRHITALLRAAATVYAHAASAEQLPIDQAPRDLERVSVSAADSGPHIWEYRRGDHRVFVLGVVFPEPKNIDFIPNTIEKAIGASGAVLSPPGVVVGEGVSIWRALTLWPSIRKAKYLPEGKYLTDVLPAQTQTRWNALKDVYLGNDRDVERMLPMYAGWKLYEALLDKEGIDKKSTVTPMVERVAKADRIEMIDAKFHLTINDPKTAVHEFAIDPNADLACLDSTMSGVETLPSVARELADAWSGGDVPAMSAALDKHTIIPQCWSSLTNEAIARQQGLDLNEQIRKAWFAALELAGTTHPVVFTTAQVADVLHRTGRIRWLLDAGYVPVDTAEKS